MKRVSFLLVIISFILALVYGCHSVMDHEEEAKEDKIKESEIKDELMEDKLYEEIGILNKIIDENSIEIERAEGTETFILTEEAKEALEQVKENDEVIYTYYKNKDEYYIEMIEEYWYHRSHHYDEESFEEDPSMMHGSSPDHDD